MIKFVLGIIFLTQEYGTVLATAASKLWQESSSWRDDSGMSDITVVTEISIVQTMHTDSASDHISQSQRGCIVEFCL